MPLAGLVYFMYFILQFYMVEFNHNRYTEQMNMMNVAFQSDKQ